MRWRILGIAGLCGLAAAAHGGDGSQTGSAAIYSTRLEGRPTASGEPFRQSELTAAHPSLPLGSLAQVTNLATGQHTLVRINDRGPFDGTHVVDLSRAAAVQIGMSGNETVRIDPIRGSLQ